MPPRIVLFVLLFAAFVAGCADQPAAQRGQTDAGEQPVLPVLSESDYTRIANRIYRNETGADPRKLTHWNEGEDFPSLGIGHFIWFPQGVDAPFDESFPPMLDYVRERSAACVAFPEWLAQLETMDSPWRSKAGFDAAMDSPRMRALRLWLESTMSAQVRYIVASFERRWEALPDADTVPLTPLLERLTAAPQGLFAVLDYYNFKGLGNNPRERYQGKGWGLLQVLGDVQSVAGETHTAAELSALFAEAAAKRLRQRAELAPPERNEARWIPGWMRRVAEYKNDPAVMGSGFRVQPYIRQIASDSVSLQWYSHEPGPGRLRIMTADGEQTVGTLESRPTIAEALTYHAAEPCLAASALEFLIPHRHWLDIDALNPGTAYRYEVTQGGFVARGGFRTPSGEDRKLRFIVYGDSETEPESTGDRVLWPEPGGGNNARRYPVDQTSGYAANLEAIAERAPQFVAIAGDLVESGGEQRDWDEFWRQNAALAADVPIYPAPGNHEYYGGPGELGGYSDAASRRAIEKYRHYFAPLEADRNYYSVRHGPLTLVVLDTNNGLPDRSGTDTNWLLSGAGSAAPPDWQPGSEQHAWLLETLARAQRESHFTFVVMHAAPYATGVHNREPGTDEGRDFASGVPLRSLTPVFLRYGVDAVFSGHDEMFERSVVRGAETRPDGGQVEYDLHFMVAGIGGDGLRGPDPAVNNPASRFLAHRDAPEIRDDDGMLIAGGKHYGHIEVNLDKLAGGRWSARLEPVYILPVVNAAGEPERFERRVYDDVVVLAADRDDDLPEERDDDGRDAHAVAAP
ncbi:MAG: metallophosphoesterase [Pseudomonadota bacterium]